MGKKKRMAGPSEELDLVPIMNLVTILIPFLLMASSFVSLAVIDSSLPAIGAPQPSSDEPEETLNLSVLITDEGFIVAGNDAVLRSANAGEGEDKGPTLPCKKPGCPSPDAYDYAELTKMLSEIKTRWDKEQNVILVPESDVMYEVIVLTMDAAREDKAVREQGKAKELFPYVVIAGGAE